MPNNQETPLPVVFRRWKNGDVIALFPSSYTGHNQHGTYILSYEYTGQHGNADYDAVIARTKPASELEYFSLLNELTQLGYKLQVCKRQSPAMRRAVWHARMTYFAR